MTPDDMQRLINEQHTEITQLRLEIQELRAVTGTEADNSRRDRVLLRAFMDRSDLVAWLKDERGALVYANRNWLDHFGFNERKAIGQTDFELFPHDLATRLRAGDLEVLGGHEPIHSVEDTTTHDGRVRCWQVTRFPFHNSTGERFVGGLAYDATERVRHDEEIRRLAITDPLTGLLNRRGFFLLAEPEMMRARRRQSACTIIFIDLDGLKSVNDRLGHQAGDAIIKLSALILKKAFRESDIVARIGGDEFAVFAPDTEGDIDTIRSRLRTAVDDLASNPILKAQLDFSVGLLRCGPDDSNSLDALLAKADELMYQQKRTKRSR